MKTEGNAMTLRDLTKGNVWELQENDIFALWAKPDKEDSIVDNGRHYMDIIRTAFDMEMIKVDKPEIIKKYEDRGMRVGIIPMGDKEQKWAIKKHAIRRVTDLTYENIHHISAAKVLEVIDSNFGGGWDSLNQSIKDIILNGFDISTTTLPADRLHKPGGLYEMKVNDGFEVLEIPKGNWIEAIFAKAKPQMTKLHINADDKGMFDDDIDDDSDVDIKDTYYDKDEDDDDIDEDMLTEESYRTTIEEDPDDISSLDDISDDDY